MPPDATRRPVIVAGDITIDRLTWTDRPATALFGPDGSRPNWEQFTQTRTISRPGGSLLLAEMVRRAIPGHPVLSYNISAGEVQPPGQFLQSFIDLERQRDDAFAITQLRGFGGPANPSPPIGGNEKPWLLVIDDAGNGFRDCRGSWDPLLDNGAPDWVVIKMSRPLARTCKGGLWNELRPRDPCNPPPCVRPSPVDPDRLIVIVNADDLRLHGIQLTAGLSWERVAQDFVRNLGSVGELGTLATCKHLIVRFGCEGVIHYRGYAKGRVETPTLHFDPRNMEGDLGRLLPEKPPGKPMIGLTVAFTAALAGAVVRAGPGVAPDDIVDTAICRGMEASQALLRAGFRAGEPERAPDYPFGKIFNEKPANAIISLPIPHSRIIKERSFSWRILEDVGGSPSERARLLAVEGEEAALRRAPLLQVKKLVTADRREIEGFQAIINLLKEYLATNTMTKPLSIAVFGPPGSGKSFVVEEIAAHLTEDAQKPLEFNLSQFTCLEDLQAAFHLVRDRALGGSVPFVFFDEFDVAFENRRCGWLKYLLAPMQDGKFREQAALHPLGRAVFVFAGGTTSRYSDFIEPLSMPPQSEEWKRFVEVKGPDFVSRLRGHIDILGPSRVDPDDATFAIRRAILLRFRLKERAPQLFSDKGKLAIDDGVLHAFLTIPKFHHGARSLQAIIEMSNLSDERRFTRSLLPPRAQLDLHVNAELFLDLVDHEKLPAEQRATSGRHAHECYRAMRWRQAGSDKIKHMKLDNDASMRSWSLLHPDLRESNCRQADDIPRKLRKIRLYMAELKEERTNRVAAIPKDKIDMLAELEHERWVSERLRAGWVPGPRDPPIHQTPFLTPWCDLPEHTKDNDRNAVRAIPTLLERIGYGIYHLD